MTLFRITPATLRAAALPVLPDGAEDADAAIAARFAAAAWTVLPEPGDRIAGAVREALGDARALSMLVEGAALPAWVEALEAQGDEASPRAIAAALERWRTRLDADRILLALRQGAAFGQRLVAPWDAAWPVQLADLGPHGPAALWVRGDLDALARLSRSVALVGARASSGYGEHVASTLAAGLAERGFAVVSGGAYGIDATAHRAALAAGGTTVAVLAGGLDRLYPAGNDELLRRVEQGGCLVAEAPSGTPPTRWRFLGRNRLIAALASATVVVEAGARSGSINTAGHAASLGRPLGAVPGPVTSGGSAGCHRLLRDYGAQLVETAAHVAELVDGPEAATPTRGGQTADETRVADALSTRSARGVDDVAERAGMAAGEARAALALLELAGIAAERGGGWVRLA